RRGAGLLRRFAPRNDDRVARGCIRPVDNRDKLRPPGHAPGTPGNERVFALESPSTMRFSPQFLDELRARLPASEVVGRRVKLRKAGREWKGLSPFNKEKTPSFTVNNAKRFYHHSSSIQHDTLFDFGAH